MIHAKLELATGADAETLRVELRDSDGRVRHAVTIAEKTADYTLEIRIEDTSRV